MHSFAWWPTLAVLSVASLTDLRSRRIPNWLVIPFLLAGFCVSTYRSGLPGLLQSAEGFALGAAIYGVLYLLGGMGMGDLKLFAAVGCWIGPHQLLVALVLISIVGGLMALALAVSRGFLDELLSGTGDLLAGFGRRGLRPHPDIVLSNPAARKMPYAPAIAIGTLLSFFSQ